MIFCRKHNHLCSVHYGCLKCRTCYAGKEEAEKCCKSEVEIKFWCEECYDYSYILEDRIIGEKHD